MKDINELLEIAKKCEQYEEYDLALKYYKTVLDASPNLQTAEIGVDRVRSEMAKCVYYVTPASFKLSEGRIELRKGSIVFMVELAKKLKTKVEFEFMEVASYEGLETTGKVKIIKDLRNDTPVIILKYSLIKKDSDIWDF